MSTTERRQPPPDTPSWERRLISAAAGGDREAQHRLLVLYEPMVRYIVRGLYLPGGEREDLAQEARVGLFEAARDWDPAHHVPFRCFAWLCAASQVRMAVTAANTHKHLLLTTACSMQRLIRSERPEFVDGGDDAFPGTSPAAGSPQEDPVAKVLAREELGGILGRVHTLSELERRALAVATAGHPYREIARALGIRVRAVNNALQRARRKLAVPACT
jgi:RNA polymerase sporulation-specific sigma factor